MHKNKKENNFDLKEVTKLRNQGYSIVQLGKHFGCCTERMRQFLCINDISTRKVGKLHKCSICGETNPNKFNGLSNSTCSLCSSRNHTKRNIDKRLKAKKDKGGKCFICGYDKFIGALEFHHINPNTKEHSLVHTFKLSDTKIKEELDKCVLLCSNCHKEVHAGLHKDKELLKVE